YAEINNNLCKEIDQKLTQDNALKLAEALVNKSEAAVAQQLLDSCFNRFHPELAAVRANQIAEELGPRLQKYSNPEIGDPDLPADLGKMLKEEFTEYNRRRLQEKCRAAITKNFQVSRVNFLVDRMAEAIVDANGNAQPVKMKAAMGKLSGHAQNRRYFMADGSIKYNPKVLEEGLVKHAGPVDEDVGFIMFSDEDSNEAIASVSSFAMHVCCLGPIDGVLPDGREINFPDYPIYLEQALQREFGMDFVSLFGQGPCGDINHVDCFNPDAADGFAECKRHGEALAGVILQELPTAKEITQPSLAVLSETVDAPFRSYTEEELAWARGEEVAPEVAARLNRNPNKKRFINRLADARERGEASRPAEVQAFRLSKDVAIVTMPGEIFVEYGMDIKKASPFPTTLVIELSNVRDIGYVPTQKAIDQAEINSFKVETARIGAEGGEAIAGAAVRLLQQLAED
ncbi:MAG: hypothetical protein JXA52_03655, partial [Planctomycetes bacterium]|nr:hypothetical protein [Planctomycetota bacterium]